MGREDRERERAESPTSEQSEVEKRNQELMQTLDDAWNAQDLETFAARHKDDVVVKWPAKPATHGVHDHRTEAIEFFRAFPDQHSTTGRTSC